MHMNEIPQGNCMDDEENSIYALSLKSDKKILSDKIRQKDCLKAVTLILYYMNTLRQ